MSDTGFALISTTPVASLGLELRQYRHHATGARHYHFDCADSNNAFMVAFPTLPDDSTGVAHILEHTTLCGSARYPVRDPFFNMLRRSLNTFMNAFTAPDSTAYPFATQNRKDFDNLLKVYLDAVFFPTLHPLDFAQEGWRLERADAAESDAPALTYHGVVYNEMKGAMSSPMAQLWQHLHAAVFPDVIYRHNSGGDPLTIPALTHAALKAFHARHYHPGNAVFMTYGNFPEAEHQRHMAELVLARHVRPPGEIIAPLQTPFSAPRSVNASYDVDTLEPRSTHIVWAWMMGEAADPDAFIDAQVLQSILLEHSASPLRHLLETTELADAPSELCGVDDSGRQLVFMCGVEGSEEAHVEALETAVLGVLDKVAVEGSSVAALDAIVDRLEMAQRDIGSSGSFPFGLALMQRVLPAALYHRDPAPLLELTPAIERLRRAIAEPGYVRELMQRTVLGNAHRARVVMVPETGLRARDDDSERDRLVAIERAMSQADLAELDAATQALEARQALVDDPDILPCLTLADVPAGGTSPSPQITTHAGVEVSEFACAANGVFRVQAAYALPQLPLTDLALVPLLTEYLLELGHGDDEYLAIQERRARLGAFSAHAVTRTRLDDATSVRGWLVVAGKGLARKRDLVIDEVGSLLAGVRFDESDRLRELLMQARAEAEQSITDRGHLLALMTAARGYSPGAMLDELWDGPSAIRLLKALGSAQTTATAIADVFSAFERIRQAVLAAPRQVLLIGDANMLDGAAARCAVFGGVAGQHTAFAPSVAADGRDDVNGWLVNSQVNFCARAYAAVPEESPDAPILAVLGRYLSDGFLHGEIREKGGAYGAGASYDPDSCTFRFYSYRDPRASATLADFDRALDWLADEHDARRLEESILGTIRALDQPRPPTGEAERAFFNRLYNRSDVFRERFRARVLAVTHADLQRVTARYLEPSTARTAVVASSASEREFAGDGIIFARL